MSGGGAARGMSLCVLALFLGCAPASRPVSTLTIVVDQGRFGSVEAAAHAETQVNWWDADTADDDACTTSFAALELQRFLPGCFGMPADSVRLAPAVPGSGEEIELRIARGVGPPGSFRLRALQQRSRR